MTQRDLTGGVSSRIAAGVVHPVLFVEAAFYAAGSPDETFLRLWTGVGDLAWDGKTWTGAGHLLRLSPMEESSEIKAVGFSVELSGLPQSILSLALANARQGRAGRVWLGLIGSEGYLSLPGESGDYAYTLDSAQASITSDIDIRAKIAASDWTPAVTMDIVDKRNVSNISYCLRLVATSGRLNFAWSEDGVTEASISSTASPNVLDGEDLWVWVTADFNGSPSVYTIKFHISDDGIVWSQLGSTVTGVGYGAIFDGTSRLSVGASYAGASSQFAGKIYYAEVRDGIGGPVVARFDPATDADNGDTAFASSLTGETWTINQTGSPAASIVVATNQLIADPYLLRSGRMDYISIDAAGDDTVITAQYEGRLVDLQRTRERRYTDEDQGLDYPTDGGFRFVAGLQDKQLIWGGPGAASSPLAAPAAADSDSGESVRTRRLRDGDD